MAGSEPNLETDNAPAPPPPNRNLLKVSVVVLLVAGLAALLWDGVGRRARSAARQEVRKDFLAYLDALREGSPAELSLDQAVLAHAIATELSGDTAPEDASITTSHEAFLSSLQSLERLQTPTWIDHDPPHVCRFGELTGAASLRGLQDELAQVRTCADALLAQGFIDDAQALTRRLDGAGVVSTNDPASAVETSFANFVEPVPPALLPRRTLAMTAVDARTHLYQGGIARSWLGADPQRCPESATKDVRGCQGAEIAWRTWSGDVQRQTVEHPPGLIFWKTIGLGSDGTAFLLGSCSAAGKESASDASGTSWCLRAVTPQGQVRDVVRPWSDGASLQGAFGADGAIASSVAEAFGDAPPRSIQSATPLESGMGTWEDQHWIGDEYGLLRFESELLILATRTDSDVSGTVLPLAPKHVEESSALWRHPEAEDVLAVVSRGAAHQGAGSAWVLLSLDGGQTWRGETALLE